MTTDEKARSVKQWTRTPCGSSSIKSEEGSAKFFEDVRKNRYQSYAPWLKKLIESQKVKGKKLLEIGCGMGTDLLEFSKGGAKCYGIDLTPKHIELAKKLFKINGRKADLRVMDAEKLKFNDNKFDFVYSHGVLHHTPNIEKSFSEINRVLKKRGKAVIMLYSKKSLAFLLKVILYHGIIRAELLRKSISDILSEVIEEDSEHTKPYVKVYTKPEVKTLLEKTGFKVEKNYSKHLMNAKRSRIIPKSILAFLERFLGWYIVVEARKL